MVATLSGRRSVRAVAALVLFLGTAGVVAAQRLDAAPTTIPLAGAFSNIHNVFGPGPDCPNPICSAFDSRGVFTGPGFVVVDGFFDLTQPGQPFTPRGYALSSARTTIKTALGDISCEEQAVFDLSPGDHDFVDLCRITGGTGHFAGATGYLQEAGTFNFDINRGQASYTGKLTFNP